VRVVQQADVGVLSCCAGAQEWWNSGTVSQFWRTWNLPVHHWILRTAHAPALRAGASKMGAVVPASH